MSRLDCSGALPMGVARSLEALAAFGALLSCIDEARWASLARPAAHGMAVIALRLHEDLALEIDALVSQTIPPG